MVVFYSLLYVYSLLNVAYLFGACFLFGACLLFALCVHTTLSKEHPDMRMDYRGAVESIGGFAVVALCDHTAIFNTQDRNVPLPGVVASQCPSPTGHGYCRCPGGFAAASLGAANWAKR